MKHIGELLPVDGFQVICNVSLPQHYQASLYHLYQPLIGMESIHLYEFFIHEAQLTTALSVEKQTHHTLMNHLNVPLHEIYKARLNLEAIGLLQTYKEENQEGRQFTYQLVPPFSPPHFFNDLMLAELLERHVGSRRFKQLKQFYIKKKEPRQGTNITASFHDVFQTYEPKSSTVLTSDISQTEPTIHLDPIDFTLLASVLKQRNIPVSRVLTETNERMITQLAHLYDLETYELEKALLWALTDEHELNIEQFKAACHDFFTAKTKVSNVKLSLKKEPSKSKQTKPKQFRSKTDELVAHLESISPKQLLEDLSGGNHASEQDLKMIREIMIKQGLAAPVMNVLIHFTMLKTNMMLSRPYMERIASHWSRAQLKTAKEAMEFALRQSNGDKPSTRRQSYRKSRQANDEVIPEWFKERHSKEESSKEKSLSAEEIKAQKEMAAILDKYSN